MQTIQLTEKVRSLKELKLFAEELQGEITALEDELKAEMTAQGAEELIVDMFKLRYSTVKNNRFDTAAFKQTHAELYNQYARQTEYRRFLIV